MICPSCGHDNLPGADLCDDCGMDLAGLDIPSWGVDPEDPVLGVPLGDLPLKEPLVLPAEAEVGKAIDLMRERGEGCVFVLDEAGHPVGVFTERDLCTRVAVPARDLGGTALVEVMTPDPVSLERQDPLAWALHRMGVDGYRHLPVTDEGRLVGFLSARVVMRWFLTS